MASLSPVPLPSCNRMAHRPTLQIQELVALSYGIHPKHMTARWRGYRHISWARQVAMYLTRELTHRSYPAIGNSFGGRDHSTVFHAFHQVQKRMKEDPFVRADVKALRKALEG